ncbi:hypothetical protein Tco_1019762 [Tanacetum coccineum]|uniref:Uncharacterized protein n=1 Tax=Tanacetum coccineum TaxID=301880 RepID=A0ABQ5FY85_9ASTR
MLVNSRDEYLVIEKEGLGDKRREKDVKFKVLCILRGIFFCSGIEKFIEEMANPTDLAGHILVRRTVWRSSGLRYETSEKKVDEVDFISQRVELVSRVSATMTKARVKVNLTMRWWIDFLWKVVRWIDDEFVEEVERSWDGSLSKTLVMKEDE